jgi:hypothetical protein
MPRPPKQQQAAPKAARFGVYLDLATRKELLKAAIDDGISATTLVENLITHYLAGRRKKAEHPRHQRRKDLAHA